MLYKSCSIQSVIARVIRNTRVQDSSFLYDMHEWIAEAMGLLKTSMSLDKAYADIKICFHKGKLPTGLMSIQAVEYKGKRLRMGLSQKHYSKEDVTFSDAFHKSEEVHKLEEGEHCYNIEMDYITTTIKEGCVRVHYLALPSDDDGYPLIPDNENYKEALYYYIRAKMIGAGFEDKVYREDVLLMRFETYGRRAINEITYPSVDKMESILQRDLYFVPPPNYYDNFFK